MSRNNTAYLKDENLLSLLSLNNLIVPEIQREYVWGKSENKKVLKRFLNSIKSGCKTCNDCKQVHKEKDINIGFLYSYKPSYVTLDHDRYLDEYLIDGQQRFTTLFLLLAFLAVNENRIKDFIAIIRFDEILEKINFDYKVRNLTHRFLIDFLSSFDKDKSYSDIFPIENQTWFLSDYQTDITIKAMLGALQTITEIFNDDFQYFDFILTAVRFWHFKTEATSQGEELYITMNSRGEKLAGNEEQKAQILNLPPEQIPEWGHKWESWQDFFWKNRGNTPNADKGFNEFVRWIRILEPDKTITTEIVEKYFMAVAFLFKPDGIFKNNMDWLSPEKEEGNTQIILFRLLPVIKFVEKFGIETEERAIVRVKQFFKNLSKIENVSKSVNILLTESLKIIDKLPDTDIASILKIDKISTQILTAEEKKKFEIYINASEKRIEIEDAFWKTEGHKIWNGEILPLIHWATENDYFDLNKFEQYNKVFNELFHDTLEYSELDITRRALLTRNLKNYPRVFRGNKNYCFCWEYSDWQTIIKDNELKFGEFLKNLFDADISTKLMEMIDNNPADKDYDEFVKIPELLYFCKQKNIQWDSENGSWVLVGQQKRSGTQANLYAYRLYLDLKNAPFWNTEKWTQNFYDLGSTCIYFDFSEKHTAIDVLHKQTIDNLDTDTKEVFFQLQLFNRDGATENEKQLVENIANQFKLYLSDNRRYHSTKYTKENIIDLLKKIMQKIETP